MHYDVAVIGGGPSGMMAAGRAAELGTKVVLIEKNTILGKKLLISGGGRCNILNAEFDTRSFTEKYGKKGKALFSAFSQFDVQSTVDFFESQGLRIKVEAEKRAFPVSDRAVDVQKTMIRYMQKGNVDIRLGIRVKGFKMNEGSVSAVVTDKGSISVSNVILATGGKSHPETGSTGDGFAWMAQFGHTVLESSMALVPVSIRNPWVRDVAGISLKGVKLTVLHDGRKHDARVGKILFTHEGLSGPLVLNISKKIGELLEEGNVNLSIDLFPLLDHGALDRKILSVFETGKNKMMKNNIGEIVQPRLGHTLLELAGIDGSVFLHQLTKEQRVEFVRRLKDIPLSVSGLLGADKAVVTGGGVLLSEIDFKTMRSKKCDNLFVIGDLLDFDRPSGGFSLQICWTTGYIAGTSAAEK